MMAPWSWSPWLPNCEKINVSCFTSPSLWYFPTEAQAKTSPFPYLENNGFARNDLRFFGASSTYYNKRKNRLPRKQSKRVSSIYHWLIHTRDIKCHAEKTRVRNRSKWNSENRNHHKSMNREGGLRNPSLRQMIRVSKYGNWDALVKVLEEGMLGPTHSGMSWGV